MRLRRPGRAVLVQGCRLMSVVASGAAFREADCWHEGRRSVAPSRRSGLPRDIAAAALLRASNAGAFVNCDDLVVNGGMTAGGRSDCA